MNETLSIQRALHQADVERLVRDNTANFLTFHREHKQGVFIVNLTAKSRVKTDGTLIDLPGATQIAYDVIDELALGFESSHCHAVADPHGHKTFWKFTMDGQRYFAAEKPTQPGFGGLPVFLEIGRMMPVELQGGELEVSSIVLPEGDWSDDEQSKAVGVFRTVGRSVLWFLGIKENRD